MPHVNLALIIISMKGWDRGPQFCVLVRRHSLPTHVASISASVGLGQPFCFRWKYVPSSKPRTAFKAEGSSCAHMQVVTTQLHSPAHSETLPAEEGGAARAPNETPVHHANMHLRRCVHSLVAFCFLCLGDILVWSTATV